MHDFDPCWSVICSLGGPLSHDSPVVVFFDRGHPHFWNFDSTIPVDVVRVKSYVNCLFDPCKSLISKDRNAPIRAVEKQLITAEHHALWDHAWPVDLKKTSSMQSKRRDLHHTWLHRETNEKLSFYCYSPRWISKTFSTKKKWSRRTLQVLRSVISYFKYSYQPRQKCTKKYFVS